ncbi:MAG: hydrogenase maturation nickel metallochaperone HypA [Rhodospirillaceae bacterium]
MHELSVSRSIVDIACERATAAGARRVLGVRVAVGALSHVDAGAIAFCFEAVARGTLAEGAALTIERPPGRAWCPPCGSDVAVGGHGEPCPRCGGHGWILAGGDELRVLDLEVT